MSAMIDKFREILLEYEDRLTDGRGITHEHVESFLVDLIDAARNPDFVPRFNVGDTVTMIPNTARKDRMHAPERTEPFVITKVIYDEFNGELVTDSAGYIFPAKILNKV